MPRKKKPDSPTPRNPVAHHAGKVNKAAVHTDKKKEQKKTGRLDGKSSGNTEG
jgi:hypothetical protein